MAFKRKSEKAPRSGQDQVDGGLNDSGERSGGSVLVADGPPPAGSGPAATRAMPPAYKGRLGDLLLEKNLVTEEQLEKALAEQGESGGKLGEILVNMGALDPQVAGRDPRRLLRPRGGEPSSRQRRPGGDLTDP